MSHKQPLERRRISRIHLHLGSDRRGAALCLSRPGLDLGREQFSICEQAFDRHLFAGACTSRRQRLYHRELPNIAWERSVVPRKGSKPAVPLAIAKHFHGAERVFREAPRSRSMTRADRTSVAGARHRDLGAGRAKAGRPSDELIKLTHESRRFEHLRSVR